MKLLFDADANKMMSRIVENISSTKTSNIVRVGETYLYECGMSANISAAYCMTPTPPIARTTTAC